MNDKTSMSNQSWKCNWKTEILYCRLMKMNFQKLFLFQPPSKEKEKQFNNIWNKLCIHICFFSLLLPLIPSCCIWKDLARSSSNSLQFIYANINCCLLAANIASQIIKTKLNSFRYWYICAALVRCGVAGEKISHQNTYRTKINV